MLSSYSLPSRSFVLNVNSGSKSESAVEETSDSAVVSISEDSGIEDPEELQDAKERAIEPVKTIAKNFFIKYPNCLVIRGYYSIRRKMNLRNKYVSATFHKAELFIRHKANTAKKRRHIL